MPRLRAWNATRTSYPREKTVATLFEETAAAHPNSIALVFEGRQVTYSELNARANELAQRLIEMSVGAESMVGCCMERSIELIVSMIAILKAGAAFVPLDPAYPKTRLSLMIDDTGTNLVLTQAAVMETALADYRHRSVLVDARDVPAEASARANPARTTGPNSLAYVMYTSGTTGRPKGVMVENRAIVRLVRNTNFCRFDPADVFLLFAPISFDASTLEIWGPLLNGGRLVIMPPGPASVEELGRVIREQRVTTLWLTSGLFSVMVEERLEDLRPVRQLLAGGDVLSPHHVRLVLDKLPDCTLINGYGPTENTTFTCCHVMRHGERVPDPIPIGRPISNTEVYILDDQLQPVTPGMVGELFAAGDGLARGYLNDPEASRQKFLPNPLAAASGERMYRTGDLARWRDDGVVEFLGRSDNQVKIRGHRIELGEIEASLASHERIKQSCVVPHLDDKGSKRLVAYYLASDSGLSPAALRAYLAANLPHPMIPAMLVPVASFPLTPNGKIDRSALPNPDSTAQSDHPGEAAATELEATIIATWRQYLSAPHIGANDNFFDVGGDSLLLVRVHKSLQEKLQIDISLVELFEFPTVRALAQRLGGRTSVGSPLVDARQRAQRQRAAFARLREPRVQNA